MRKNWVREHGPQIEPLYPSGAAICLDIDSVKRAWKHAIAMISLGGMLISGFFFSADLSARDITEADRQHWAFQPLRPVKAPTLPHARTSNPIDLFILARLETN